MDNGYFGFIFVVIIFGLWFSSSKETDRSDVSNTDMYLRRINKKLDKLAERFDKRSYTDKYQAEIEEAYFKASLIIECTFLQLKLLRRGKVQTGFWAYCTQNFRNKETKEFDSYEDYVVDTLTEKFDYTKEEAVQLRKTLANRFIAKEAAIEVAISSTIISENLSPLIEHEIIQDIISESSGKPINNIWLRISQRYDQLNKDLNLDKIVEKAIKEGVIKSVRSLECYLHKLLQQTA